MANPRARSRLNAPSTECRCQPVASTSSSAVAPCLLARRSTISPNLPPGRGVGGACTGSGARTAASFRDVVERDLLDVAIGRSSCVGHAKCTALHHPKPRSRSPGRFPRPAPFDFRGPASRRQYRSNRRRSPDIKDRARSWKATAAERGASPPCRRWMPGSATDTLGDAKSHKETSASS